MITAYSPSNSAKLLHSCGPQFPLLKNEGNHSTDLTESSHTKISELLQDKAYNTAMHTVSAQYMLVIIVIAIAIGAWAQGELHLFR